MEVCWSEEVCGWVLDKANPDETGARGIRQIVQNDVEARLADEIINGDLTIGDTARLDVEEGELVIRIEEPTLEAVAGASV